MKKFPRLFAIYLILGFSFWGCSSDANRTLVTASGDGDVEKIQELLRNGADVNFHLFDSGITPLMAASKRGNIAAIEALLVAGADINATDHDVGTALYWAAFEGQLESMNILLKRGARLRCKKESTLYLLKIIRAKGRDDVLRLVLAHLRKECPEQK
ncbi:ankyrin repeat domain-containing protein [Solimonas sp. K1W22B-7]|uniref:ankyrin repeat domain-containing protein n=1 Tax=Solimonas sp. K1W22B-7 TaxID=2303331 RepID=UPI000E33797D|nr:ankyrin repeat domain-containing protein [Solimonas sp. K1W22B-7]AXQ29223.1 ankyrin repeat domain-containing protein [Solimonas sp. K1W22B-7]